MASLASSLRADQCDVCVALEEFWPVKHEAGYAFYDELQGISVVVVRPTDNDRGAVGAGDCCEVSAGV